MAWSPRVSLPALAFPRGAWLQLLATPSSYLAVIALVATMAVKLRIVVRLDDLSRLPSRWMATTLADIAVFLALAAVLALLESTRRRAAAITIPIAAVVCALAVINAIQLNITGEQLNAQVLLLAVERLDDVRRMAGATIQLGVLGVVLPLAGLLTPPALAHLWLRRDQQPRGVAVAGRARAGAAASVAGIALLLHLLVPAPSGVLRRIQHNALFACATALVTNGTTGRERLDLFAGYDPRDLVAPEAIARLRARGKPNILVVVLESTRRDATSLAGADALTRTPHLEALAARGLEFTHARAVMPHTTKSMWSMLCGRLPIVQPKVYETASSLAVQCLPHILGEAGWRTGFLQSARGAFEDRPRLIDALGFDSLITSDLYTSIVLGYVASDDELLPAQLGRWLDADPQRPFMAMVLTSGTHHPYVMSPTVAARAALTGASTRTDRDRYLLQVQATDRMLGEVARVLDERGLTSSTIVIVLGDHGEGFGEKVTLQHGSNYYEEGLRVPFVLAGPGVPHGRRDDNLALLDLAPTVLALLGEGVTDAARATTPARSALTAPPTPRVLPFSCFLSEACEGYVQGDVKVVAIPWSGEVFAFDLRVDPNERAPQPLTAPQARQLREVQDELDRHRTVNWPRPLAELRRYPPWVCAPGVVCKLPPACTPDVVCAPPLEVAPPLGTTSAPSDQ